MSYIAYTTNPFDHVSRLEEHQLLCTLLDSPVGVAQARFNINNNLSVKLENEPFRLVEGRVLRADDNIY